MGWDQVPSLCLGISFSLGNFTLSPRSRREEAGAQRFRCVLGRGQKEETGESRSCRLVRCGALRNGGDGARPGRESSVSE